MECIVTSHFIRNRNRFGRPHAVERIVHVTFHPAGAAARVRRRHVHGAAILHAQLRTWNKPATVPNCYHQCMTAPDPAAQPTDTTPPTFAPSLHRPSVFRLMRSVGPWPLPWPPLALSSSLDRWVTKASMPPTNRIHTCFYGWWYTVIFLNFLLHDGDYSKRMPEIGFCVDHSDDRRVDCVDSAGDRHLPR